MKPLSNGNSFDKEPGLLPLPAIQMFPAQFQGIAWWGERLRGV